MGLRMNKKKILVVSATFYPLNTPRSNRATELVKEFALQGHQVTVLTIKEDEHHPPFELKHHVTIKGLGKRKWKSIAIKGSGLTKLFWRVLFRLMNLLFEYPDIELTGMVKKALRKESGYDLMISIAVPYPVHWGVAAARSKSHPIATVWVADCGDPYMGDKADSFKKMFYFKYIEQWFCRKADFLTVPVEGAIWAYYPQFHSKIKIIPQGFNFEETPVYTGEVKNEIPTFAYAGGFIPGIRDPRELLIFLTEYSGAYKFILYTANADLVTPYMELSGNRIELRTYVPRAQLLFELSKMDFLINFTNGTTVQTPSKLIDYAIANRPVLSVDTGKLPVSLLNEFLQGDYSHRIETGDKELYNIKKVANQFALLA
jgi:hypothetical protein